MAHRVSRGGGASVALLLLLTVAACGQDGAQARGAGGPAPAGAPTLVAATLETSTSDHGKVVVDEHGRTLYMFTADLRGSESRCTDACTAEWPALDAPAAHAGMHVSTMLISTIERPNGVEQATYAEHPLYYFSGDDHIGDTEGHGVTAFGGTWLMLRPDGSPVRP